MSDTATIESPPAPASAPLTSQDVFTGEEAWRYLKLPSKRSFDHNRREIEKQLNVKFGRRFGRTGSARLYPREHLDQMRKILFGLDTADQEQRGPRKKH